ncbi:MAG: hypothetical protein ABIE47_12920 [Pseudomonadota bacterium]
MPTASESMKIIILWEHEIVAAVQAFDKLRGKKKPASEEIANAFKAAYAALYHPAILSGNPFVIMSANRDFFPKVKDPEDPIYKTDPDVKQED